MDAFYNDYMKYFCNDGFLIPKLQVEIPLYRYRGNIKNVIDEIENDHIYMAPLAELNDPFDSSCATSFEETCQLTKPIMYFHIGAYFLDNGSWYKELDNYIRSIPDSPITLTKYSELVSDFAKNKGVNIKPKTICQAYYLRCMRTPTQKRKFGKVACFSETWESIPMWSYYADSHKGVCVKYEFSLLDRNDITYKNICASLQKVWYSQKRFMDSKNEFTPFVKSLEWSHEQEWRFFRESDEEYLYMPCLTEIYLGINFDYDNIDCIIEAIKKNGRDIKMFMVNPKPDAYGFERIPLVF